MGDFGKHIRQLREAKYSTDKSFSVRKLAERVGLDPTYLSRIERDQEGVSLPKEEKIAALARELGENPDVLLALAGKVSSRLLAIIRRRPQMFAQLLEQLEKAPDDAVLRVVRQVRDGDW